MSRSLRKCTLWHASHEDSDHHAHLRSLISAIPVYLKKAISYTFHTVPSEGSDQEVAGLNSAGSGNIFFMGIDYEIFSTVILFIPLIQEGQLSVSGERMCTSTG